MVEPLQTVVEGETAIAVAGVDFIDTFFVFFKEHPAEFLAVTV